MQVDRNKRWVIFPIQYPDLWDWYKKQQASFWTEDEVDLSEDKWDLLTPDEQHFIKYTLAFFAASDSIVNENLVNDFISNIDIYEAKMFYDLQVAMEDIHSISYSKMIDAYIKDNAEKDFLFNGMQNIDIIRKKAEWAIRYIEEGTLEERMIAFACVEGIFFSSSFASIYWLKEQNKLVGLCTYNDFISRDEGMHRDFAVYLYNNYMQKISNTKILEMVHEAIELEKEFATEALPVRLLGINQDSMVNYIQYVGNTLLHDLGIDVVIGNNPLKFMEKIAIPKKVNFFEVRPTEYQKMTTNDIKFTNDF